LVCLGCGESWDCCCPACGSREILFEAKRPRSFFYEWLEKVKHVSNPERMRSSDLDWDRLWKEYIEYLNEN